MKRFEEDFTSNIIPRRITQFQVRWFTFINTILINLIWIVSKYPININHLILEFNLLMGGYGSV
jgi:hypothetical protein